MVTVKKVFWIERCYDITTGAPFPGYSRFPVVVLSVLLLMERCSLSVSGARCYHCWLRRFPFTDCSTIPLFSIVIPDDYSVFLDLFPSVLFLFIWLLLFHFWLMFTSVIVSLFPLLFVFIVYCSFFFFPIGTFDVELFCCWRCLLEDPFRCLFVVPRSDSLAVSIRYSPGVVACCLLFYIGVVASDIPFLPFHRWLIPPNVFIPVGVSVPPSAPTDIPFPVSVVIRRPLPFVPFCWTYLTFTIVVYPFLASILHSWWRTVGHSGWRVHSFVTLCITDPNSIPRHSCYKFVEHSTIVRAHSIRRLRPFRFYFCSHSTISFVILPIRTIPRRLLFQWLARPVRGA